MRSTPRLLRGYQECVAQKLQVSEQSRHRRIQSLGDHLEGNDPCLAFPSFNVGYMPAVHVKVNGHIRLRPSFFLTQHLDTLSQLNQESMIATGHSFMVAILSEARVWHARHS
jgi:hypothetical protein